MPDGEAAECRRLVIDGGRDAALEQAAALVRAAWRSFDEHRPGQPRTSDATQAIAREALPRTPRAIAGTLAEAERILDESLAQSRPRYFAFVGSSGLEVAVLGDLLASAHDVNLATSALAADLIEAQAVRWVGELVGYPAAAGYFTSGGMVSNLTALAAAREHALPGSRAIGLAGQPTALYASAEAHSSVMRAADVLGIGAANVRAIPIDHTRGLRPDLLADAIARDRGAGVAPIAIVATAGTTLTGAVDPLRAIADIADAANVWLHVDGAYGLPAASARTTAHLFAGLERADSVAVDAHKWLYVPKACGCLMVRDAGTLTSAFAHDSGYMLHDEGGPSHAVDQTLEYSRPFRALKLWLALRTHGADAFCAAIERNLAQARLLADLVRAASDLELLAGPTLSVVPFRHRPAGVTDLDAHNRALVRALQIDGRVWVSDAVVDERVCLRPCFVNFRTTEDDVRALVDVVREIGHRSTHA